MEIVNRKEIRTFLYITIAIIILSVVIPVLCYLIEFKDNKFSNDPADWGTFGDYMGGITGTVFGLIAALFSLISIVITLRIATRIQEFEAEQSKLNAEREETRFSQGIDLSKKQNIPLPFLQMTRYPEKTEITICNHGIGPLIIKKWHLKYLDKDYKNFDDLMGKNLKPIFNENEIQLYHNTSPEYVISPGNTQVLFSISSKTYASQDFINFQIESRNFFQNTTICFHYEDIFYKKILEESKNKQNG